MSLVRNGAAPSEVISLQYVATRSLFLTLTMCAVLYFISLLLTVFSWLNRYTVSFTATGWQQAGSGPILHSKRDHRVHCYNHHSATLHHPIPAQLLADNEARIEDFGEENIGSLRMA